jgi:glycosidase
VRLILDYVPNHVAPDHPWVTEHPEFFIQGDDDDLKADPAGWLRVGGHVLAHGRDPYFPPWPDVVQLNAFAPAARAATARTLADIAGQCDGIRCDMAMLMFNDIFAKTWGSRAGQRPDEEFWPAVIAGLRSGHPETVLIAEAYWDTEWALQQQGFAFCYDKRLYDRILGSDPSEVRGHLLADLSYQSRMVRFLENHDEPRIADELPAVLQRAAAVSIATLPGATFWHQGQFEGRRVPVPVFLDRRADEGPDEQLAAWHRDLLRVVAEHRVRTGAWQLLEAGGWPDNQSCQNLLAWAWTPADDAGGVRGHLVVVNLSEAPAQAQVPLPWPDLPGRRLSLVDLLSGDDFARDGDQLADPGMYVELQPGQFYLLAVRAQA